MSADRLTPKQARFVREYPLDLDPAAAARRAGYSAGSARASGARNLAKPAIAAAIAAALSETMAAPAREEAVEAAAVTVQTVLERLIREADGQGPDTSAATRIRASELLAKYLGMLAERRAPGGAGGAGGAGGHGGAGGADGANAFSRLSDAALDRAIETALDAGEAASAPRPQPPARGTGR